ncbi:MAG: NACHT domain-containing NTPase [Cyanobacteriota bacterium]
MVTNQPEENQNPQVQQEVLKHITVGKNLTTGNITVQNYYGTVPPPAPPPLPGIDELVEQVRSLGYNKIKTMHGTLRMLRVNRPIPVDDIYIDLNVLEQVSTDRAFADWRKKFQPGWRSFDRLGLERVKQKRVPALEKVQDSSKLMILGKPGSGKTTLLKSVVIGCIEGQLQWDSQNYVPVFVTLKDFAEDVRDDRQFNLYEAIQREFRSWGVTDAQVTEAILAQGRGLILLDGLDEVPEIESRSVVKQILRFCQDYYGNRFLVTSRTQNQKYRFEGFTDVEVADFNPEQVAKFIRRWFAVVVGKPEPEVLAEKLIRQLERENNKQIAELAVTPVLLNLTCSVFRDTGSFPTNRASLYQKGLRALLEDWDEWKGVERDGIYGNLTTEDKEKLLAQVAAVLFEENDYFPERSKLERLIGKYLEISSTEAGKVLRAIEFQHGLLVERSEGFYSFSHLTFQEYFTAKWFVQSEDREGLVSHITKTHWREVFLLAVGMMENPDCLLQLMKQQVDALVADDEKLQQFLKCLSHKSVSARVPYKLVAVRAFHFEVIRALNIDVKFRFNYGFEYPFNYPLALDLAFSLDINLAFDRILARQWAINLDRHCNRLDSLSLKLVFTLAAVPELEQAVREYKEQLLEKCHDNEIIKQLWKVNGQVWLDYARNKAIDNPNIGHNWQFNNRQIELLEQYYNANKLLVDCLNNGCRMSLQVREEIEETLLLPIAEIENRQMNYK